MDELIDDAVLEMGELLSRAKESLLHKLSEQSQCGKRDVKGDHLLRSIHIARHNLTILSLGRKKRILMSQYPERGKEFDKAIQLLNDYPSVSEEEEKQTLAAYQNLVQEVSNHLAYPSELD